MGSALPRCKNGPATEAAMLDLDFHPSGRHFLQIPGPSPVPDRILRAMSLPTIDHRGPEFGALGRKVLADVRKVFKTRHPVVIYPASGTGAWEAALVNTLSARRRRADGRDRSLRRALAEDGGAPRPGHRGAVRARQRPAPAGSAALAPGVRPEQIEARLQKDGEKKIKAVCVVHNETSTGALSDIVAVRKAIDAAGHPALLLVDSISGLACADLRHDEWGIDVTVGGSQKGLMLPPGIGFNAISPRALEAARRRRCRARSGPGTRSSR